jgi:hypothetical protein
MDLKIHPPGIRLPLFQARHTTYKKGPHHGELFKLFSNSLKNEKYCLAILLSFMLIKVN